jgi:hypothetical protein
MIEAGMSEETMTGTRHSIAVVDDIFGQKSSSRARRTVGEDERR